MKLKCPACGETLSEAWVCPEGHVYVEDEGVLVLLSEAFREQFDPWLRQFEAFRAPQMKAGLKPEQYAGLPYSGYGLNKKLWQSRALDLRLMEEQGLLGKDYQYILDLGSWNGWLSHSLSKRGKKVVATDYFLHAQEGLKARNYYPDASWLSVQMNMEELAVLGGPFDLIVVNRCYPYFSDHPKLLNNLRKLLSPDGTIFFSGLHFQKKPRIAELNQARKDFAERFGNAFQFKPYKGYVDREDMDFLEKEGVVLKRYPGWGNGLKHCFFPGRAVSYYGVLRGNG